MRKQIILFLMVTLTVILFLKSNTYAYQFSLINNDYYNNIIEGDKGPNTIYNNEVITVTPLFGGDKLFSLIGYKIDNKNNKSKYYYLENPIFDFSIPEELENKIKFYSTQYTHYELDDNGNLNYIMRLDEYIYIRNLSSTIRSEYIYNLKDVPKWVDKIYLDEELSSGSYEDRPLFLSNENNIDTEEMLYKDTIYKVSYFDNTLHCLNTKNNTYSSSSLMPSLISSLIKDAYEVEEINTINIEGTSLSFISLSSSSFVFYNEEELMKDIKEENLSSISALTSFVKKEISSVKSSSIKKSIKKVKKKYKLKNEEVISESGKKVEINEGKNEEENKEKKEKKVTFTNKNSYLSVINNKLYIRKDKYYTLCDEETALDFLEGKKIEGREKRKVKVKFKEIDDKIEFEVPNDEEGCRSEAKTYMPYTAVTCKASNQYKFLYSDKAYTDEKTGLRMYEGRYCIAVGTAFTSKIGTKIDVVLENGDILNCILGDVKSDAHTDSSHQFHAIDGSVVEFIVDYDYFNRKDHILNKGRMREKVIKIIVEGEKEKVQKEGEKRKKKEEGKKKEKVNNKKK